MRPLCSTLRAVFEVFGFSSSITLDLTWVQTCECASIIIHISTNIFELHKLIAVQTWNINIQVQIMREFWPPRYKYCIFIIVESTGLPCCVIVGRREGSFLFGKGIRIASFENIPYSQSIITLWKWTIVLLLSLRLRRAIVIRWVRSSYSTCWNADCPHC